MKNWTPIRLRKASLKNSSVSLMLASMSLAKLSKLKGCQLRATSSSLILENFWVVSSPRKKISLSLFSQDDSCGLKSMQPLL